MTPHWGCRDGLGMVHSALCLLSDLWHVPQHQLWFFCFPQQPFLFPKSPFFKPQGWIFVLNVPKKLSQCLKNPLSQAIDWHLCTCTVSNNSHMGSNTISADLWTSFPFLNLPEAALWSTRVNFLHFKGSWELPELKSRHPRDKNLVYALHCHLNQMPTWGKK